MKQNRIELRASEKERARLLEAAIFSGMNLSAFLRQAALEKSDEVLKSRDDIILSNRDRDLFLEALENPPTPNKYLQQAFKDYNKRKSGVNSSAKRSASRSKKMKVATHKVR